MKLINLHNYGIITLILFGFIHHSPHLELKKGRCEHDHDFGERNCTQLHYRERCNPAGLHSDSNELELVHREQRSDSGQLYKYQDKSHFWCYYQG